jgi:hypothetical protein
MLNKILYNEYFYFSIVLALVGIFLLIYRQYFMSNFIKTNAVISGITVKKGYIEGVIIIIMTGTLVMAFMNLILTGRS